jgi:uncharacterized membrane protein
MLERPATPHDLRRLAEAGVLDGPLLERALARLHARGDRAAWRLFAERALMFVGLGLIVAAVVFFFAANCGAMTRGARLGLALAAHVVAAVIAARLGTDRTAGRAAGAVAAVLIGPALLTYGQAYQTGADAWQLFAGWTALAVPFALAVRGTALWGVVLVLARISAFLFADQVHRGHGDASWLAAAFFVLLIDIGAFVLARRCGGRWLPTLLLALGLVTVAFPLTLFILGEGDAVWGALLFVVAFAAHALGLGEAFRARHLPRAVLLLLSCALHATTFAARVVKEAHLDEASLLVLSVFVLAIGSGIAWVLHRLWALQQKEGRA